MTVANYCFTKTKIEKRDIIINILKVAAIYNAVASGWKVIKINNNTYELTKQINNNELEKYNNLDLKDFICKLIS